MADPIHRPRARPLVPSSWLDEPIEVHDLDPSLDLDAFAADATATAPPAVAPAPLKEDHTLSQPDPSRAAPAPDTLARLLQMVEHDEARAEPVREPGNRKVAVFRHTAVAAPVSIEKPAAAPESEKTDATRTPREVLASRENARARRREVPPMVAASVILVIGLGTAAYIVSRPLPPIVIISERGAGAETPTTADRAAPPGAGAAALVRTTAAAAAGKTPASKAPNTTRRAVPGESRGVATIGRGGTPASFRRTSGALPARVPKVPALPPPAPPPRDANGAPAGWLRIDAPGDLQLTVDGVSMGSTRDAPQLIAAGTHDVVLASERAGVRTTTRVTVVAGQVATVPVTLPNGTLSVTSEPQAEVLVDGRSLGTTPLDRVALAAGVRRIVVRTPNFGERSYEVVVRDGRLTELSVDLRR